MYSRRHQDSYKFILKVFVCDLDLEFDHVVLISVGLSKQRFYN